jgi:hypothetical protein
VADLGNPAADRVEHLEGRHDLARRAHRDLQRPPDSAAMRSATAPPTCRGPGSRFGHDVTMRQRFACARATEGAANRCRRRRRRRDCGV